MAIAMLLSSSWAAGCGRNEWNGAFGRQQRRGAGKLRGGRRGREGEENDKGGAKSERAHLICKEHQLLPNAEAHHLLLVLLGQHRPWTDAHDADQMLFDPRHHRFASRAWANFLLEMHSCPVQCVGACANAGLKRRQSRSGWHFAQIDVKYDRRCKGQKNTS